MNVPNISFGGRVPYERLAKIKDATAAQLASMLEDAHKAVDVKPTRPLSGKLLLEANPDCFDGRTNKLNESGKKGFDTINKRLGVTTESRLYEWYEGVKKYINGCCKSDDGRVDVAFHYIR